MSRLKRFRDLLLSFREAAERAPAHAPFRALPNRLNRCFIWPQAYYVKLVTNRCIGMGDQFKETVRIVRKDKVMTDERGRTVWNVPVEEVELELVSTEMLKTLIDSGDAEKRRSLEDAARGKEGVLAKSPTSGTFEIIDDDDLQAALDGAGGVSETVDAAEFREESLMDRADTGDEELSLVSTQMLKVMLEIDEDESEDPENADTGFNPYDHS